MFRLLKITLIFSIIFASLVYAQADNEGFEVEDANLTESSDELFEEETIEVGEDGILYLTLDDAIKYARESSVTLIESQFDYEIAKAVKWQTTSDLWLPTVSAYGSFYYIDNDTASTGLSSYGLDGSQDQWTFGLDFSRVLFAGLAGVIPTQDLNDLSSLVVQLTILVSFKVKHCLEG